LIELLVVVAIIGILASVVLANLNSARTKGADAAIKAGMSNMRAQAELFYDANGVYTDVCQPGGTNSAYPPLLSAAQKLLQTNTPGVASTDAFAYSAAGAANSSVCHDSGTAWAAITSLKVPTTANAGWCVDSTGAAREATTLDADVFACP
jgi:type II secretory pathway pseudopilin PulG